MDRKTVSHRTVQRLPQYLNLLKQRDRNSYISATTIAEMLSLNDVQVRKDLAKVSARGRPKVGYLTNELVDDIERFLGYHNMQSAVIVGVGNLGGALLSYDGFAEQGIEIVAAFDHDRSKIGKNVNNKEVFHVDMLREVCEKNEIRLGIITVPSTAAQLVCDKLVEAGIVGIWNFSPIHLNVPENVLVQNENMAVSLAILSKHLCEKLAEKK